MRARVAKKVARRMNWRTGAPYRRQTRDTMVAKLWALWIMHRHSRANRLRWGRWCPKLPDGSWPT